MKDNKTAKIDDYVPMINEIITSLGVDPSTCFDPDNYMWNLQKGSAKIHVKMFTIEYENGNKNNYIQIASPVMSVPAQKIMEFYKRLLELNDTTIGIKFSIRDNQVFLLTERELLNLDKSEAETMFHRIGNYADDIDDKLKAEFS